MRIVTKDVKLRTITGIPFKTSVLSYSNFYPFGMQFSGTDASTGLDATYESDEYRYGYNGKEKDGEVKGEGNSYDYRFRIYDPRIAKFLSIDPLSIEFPFDSPFSYASNSPILLVDVDGLHGGIGHKLRDFGMGLLKKSTQFLGLTGYYFQEYAPYGTWQKNLGNLQIAFAGHNDNFAIFNEDGTLYQAKNASNEERFGAFMSVAINVASSGHGQRLTKQVIRRAQQAASKIKFMKLGGIGQDILNKGLHFHIGTSELMPVFDESTGALTWGSAIGGDVDIDAVDLINAALDDEKFRAKVIEYGEKTLQHLTSALNNKLLKPQTRATAQKALNATQKLLEKLKPAVDEASDATNE